MSTKPSRHGGGGKRGKVTGWSPGAARRNRTFLQSVDERELKGVGLALTLTLRECPATTEEWSKTVKAWIERQARRGMLRLHWVMEFQRRGVPHLHCAIWYEQHEPDPLTMKRADRVRFGNGIDSVMRHGEQWDGTNQYIAAMAVGDWLELAEPFGAGIKGQHARPIIESVGWFQYLAKHCGRGRQHYQRQMDSLPKAWEKSPRVWGKRGDWVTDDPIEIELTNREWYKLRRLVRYQRVARTRALLPSLGWGDLPPLHTKDWARTIIEWPGSTGKLSLRQRIRHLQQARTMLRCNEQRLSDVRGLNEWIRQDQQQDLHRVIQSMRA